MEAIDTLLASTELYSSVCLLVIVIIVKALSIVFFQTASEQSALLTFFHFYCHRLENKVNKSANDIRQQRVSGLIAVLITLIPIIAIIGLFEVFIDVLWLWHGMILYCSLGNFTLIKKNQAIINALNQNDNVTAKRLISPLLLRETNQLSSIGINKASIEMTLLKNVQLLVTVAFYFLFLGPLVALSYRLLLEMHYAWNIKKIKFLYFGEAAQMISKLLEWLPSRLFYLLLLILALGKNLLLFWRLTREKFFTLGNDILLHILALCLNIKLSGVAIYQGEKLRKPSFNDQARQPESNDIVDASKYINKALYLYFMIVLLLGVFSYLVRYIPN